MNLDINVEIVDNFLGSYFLKSNEVIEINTFKDLCKYVDDMSNIYNTNVLVLWSSAKDTNKSILDLVEKDIKSRPDLFIL